MQKEILDKYEAIIGLEVHTQLLTHSKAFSSDINEFGAAPNTHISAITLAHPGTLPVLNQAIIDKAIMLGSALNCTIRKENFFARKNYFYADLPKGYQITQDKTPICTDGHIIFEVKNDKGDTYEKYVGITRIHSEEDAGKSMHDIDPFFTLIDLNRAGVPLLEIVSEPHITTAQEAYQFLTEIRKLVRYLDVCDGNMEEGSLRCDVNISVKLKDNEKWGTKVEVKNMNSMRNVKKAIEYEIDRQINLLEAGSIVQKETRTYDANNNTTLALRSKEDAHDYRYFPEPDLPPVVISQDYIQNIQSRMPLLPKALITKFMNEYGLSKYDALLLAEDKHFAQYYEDIVQHYNNKKVAANWMNGIIKNYLNEKAIDIQQFIIPAIKIAELLQEIEKGTISNTVASSTIFIELLSSPNRNVLEIANDKNVLQNSNEESIQKIINEVLIAMPEKVEEYRAGKKGLIGLFVGEVMKKSGAQADPKVVNQLLNKILN